MRFALRNTSPSSDSSTSLRRSIQVVLSWAGGVRGRIIDVGCGPGDGTDLRREEGADIEGIDSVPEFIDAAHQQYPEVPFRQGRVEDHEDREVLDGTAGGTTGLRVELLPGTHTLTPNPSRSATYVPSSPDVGALQEPGSLADSSTV
jgi:SAM-dependent methyltransferase